MTNRVKAAVLLERLANGINIASYHVAGGIITLSEKFDVACGSGVNLLKQYTEEGDPDSKVNPKVSGLLLLPLPPFGVFLVFLLTPSYLTSFQLSPSVLLSSHKS